MGRARDQPKPQGSLAMPNEDEDDDQFDGTGAPAPDSNGMRSPDGPVAAPANSDGDADPQTGANARDQLQVAQLLSMPQYVQWSANTPPWLGSFGQNAAAPDGSAPASDIGIHDVDRRAGVIAAQHGFPAGLAYASALGEARQQGARTVDRKPGILVEGGSPRGCLEYRR